MDLQKNSGMLFLSFGDHTVTYRGQAYPTGTIACMALNIDRDTLETARPHCQKIAAVHQMLRTGVVEKAQMNSARMAAHALLRLISRHEPFTFLAMPELEQRLDVVFTVEAFRKLRAYYAALGAEKLDEAARQKFGPTIDLINLTPALANFVDAVEMLQEHIGPFAEKLDAEHSVRTKEAYLARFREDFPEDANLGDGSDCWLAMANVTVQYIAGKPEGAKELQMLKQMHFLSFGSMLRADFFEGLAAGHAPKRCAHCGRWFLTTDARHTKYCGGFAPDDPRGRTCRQIGNMKGRKYRELADDHPLMKVYTRRMNTIDQSLRRGTLSPDIARAMKKLAKDKMQRAKADVGYAQEAYAGEMGQKALKEEAVRLLK